jgi:hypothetical protein
MSRLLWFIFGVPLETEDVDKIYIAMVGARTPEDTVDFLRTSASHNTEKSGALLGAQGIFVVVDIFAVDHGWPRAAILASLRWAPTVARNRSMPRAASSTWSCRARCASISRSI